MEEIAANFLYYFKFLAEIEQNLASSDISGYPQENRAKISTTDHFNHDFSKTPVQSFFRHALGEGSSFNLIFTRPVLIELFQRLEEAHIAWADQYENFKFEDPQVSFTEKLRSFQDDLETTADKIWGAVEESAREYGYFPRELMRLATHLFYLQTAELLVVVQFCQNIGISNKDFYDNFQVFSEFVRKAAMLIQTEPEDAEELSPTTQIFRQGLTIYSIVFGFAYFQGYQTYAWCPGRLSKIFARHQELVAGELTRYERDLPEDQQVVDALWFNENLNHYVPPAKPRPQAGLHERLICQNIATWRELYGFSTVGALGQLFQECFGVTDIQAALYLARYYNPERVVAPPRVELELSPVPGGSVESTVEPQETDTEWITPSNIDPTVQEDTIKEEELVTTQDPGYFPIQMELNQIYGDEFHALASFITQENLLEPPLPHEIDLVLGVLGFAVEPANFALMGDEMSMADLLGSLGPEAETETQTGSGGSAEGVQKAQEETTPDVSQSNFAYAVPIDLNLPAALFCQKITHYALCAADFNIPPEVTQDLQRFANLTPGQKRVVQAFLGDKSTLARRRFLVILEYLSYISQMP